MATQALTIVRDQDDNKAAMIERVITAGNLAELTAEERISYYLRMCKVIEVDPVIKPFDLIKTYMKGGGEIISLYPNAKLAAHLEKKHKLSIPMEDGKYDDKRGLYSVKARAIGPDGRYVEASGWVSITNLTGEYLANAMMRAETKAFRRSVLRWSGLALPDESEMVDVPGAARVDFDFQTGEIVEPLALPEPQPPPSKPEPVVTATTAPPPQMSKAEIAADIERRWTEQNKEARLLEIEGWSTVLPKGPENTTRWYQAELNHRYQLLQAERDRQAEPVEEGELQPA